MDIVFICCFIRVVTHLMIVTRSTPTRRTGGDSPNLQIITIATASLGLQKCGGHLDCSSNGGRPRANDAIACFNVHVGIESYSRVNFQVDFSLRAQADPIIMGKG
jgi:hypothetical protein